MIQTKGVGECFVFNNQILINGKEIYTKMYLTQLRKIERKEGVIEVINQIKNVH